MKSTRRQFIGQLAAIPVAVAFAGKAVAAPGPAWVMGSQSYSFRKFDTIGAINGVQKLGLNSIEFCGVHFPCDANDPDLGKVKELIKKTGIQVPCYGVESFGADEAANRKKFEFAKSMGIKILTAHPKPESFDNLDKLTEEYGVKIAIHNHGPKAQYNTVQDTLDAIKDHSPMIGACVDTGHVIRSNEKPHEVIAALGDRVHSMHLKDWIHGAEEEILGEGDIDLVAVAKVLKKLKFAGPLMVEYENSPENPGPDMKIGLANWQKAVDQVWKA
ncbi:MAG: sugar phosphate isomerase/epimerase [Candidatus Hydrogenedentes bacterium]|nr:sugar phosphate isomerase/epimerase [Candidatus Hydrogenedentota bacterium]